MKSFNFNGKRALVTGARQGIGFVTALMLAECGAKVAVVDLHITQEDEICKAIRAMGGECLPLSANVAESDDVRNAFLRVKDTFGGLDVLVNNAGITKDATVKNMTEEQFDAVLSVNLKGTFLCAKEAMALMRKDGGSIVNFSSASGFLGNVGQANYAASKAGVIGLTRTLALEGARHGIRVNAVAPGVISTPMTDAIPDNIREAIVAKIPLRRVGVPEDVAHGVLFLASELSSFITGHCLHINGGRYM